MIVTTAEKRKKNLILLFVGLLIIVPFMAQKPDDTTVKKSSYESVLEYEVYQYIEDRIWDLPLGIEVEDTLVKKAAKKFGISYKKANDIYTKQVWLRMYE